MRINYIRRGYGKPLLLVHGLGSNWRSWAPVLESLSAHRSVLAIDLPGFGKSPPLEGTVTLAALADAVAQFLRERDLLGSDAVGSSVGARLVLELARRGDVLGTVISLSPVGFGSTWQRQVFRFYYGLHMRIARMLAFAMPSLTQWPWARALLLARFCTSPRAVAPTLALEEMRSLATAPSFSGVLKDIVCSAPAQAARGSIRRRLVIGWGRHDRFCAPTQAERALALFPDARLHWLERCGHLAQWDAPEEIQRLILESTAD